MAILLVFLGCLAIAVPIAFTLGIVGVAYMMMQGMPLVLVPQRMFVQLDSFVLMACPFFVLAGSIMDAAGFTSRLIRFCQAWVGQVRGGLAIVNVGASMIFAGISGSALADVASESRILVPAMVKEGYDIDFSAAVTAASATIGPIIPPSIAFVIYGVYANVSIAGLFIGGLVPGIILGLFQMIYSYFYAIKRNYPRSTRVSWLERIKITLSASIALFGPFIIIGGILGGIFTPTEAGVVACVYGTIVGIYIFRELKWSDLPRIFKEAAVTTASVFLVVATANIFAWAISAVRLPQQLAAAIGSVSSNPAVVLLLINAFLLFMGTWMDPTANLIMLIPVLLPVVTNLGIDPLFFGIVMVFNIIIGQITPPVGLVLFLTSSVCKISLERLSRAMVPFILISILVLILITYMPKVVMFLPNLLR